MTACLGRRENKVERDLGKGTVAEKQERERTLFIQPKPLNSWKQRQMVQKFSGNELSNRKF